MTEVQIKTPYSRTLTVSEGWDGEGSKHLNITTTESGTHLSDTLLPTESVNELATALLGENATVITDLPEVTLDEDGWFASDSFIRSPSSSPERLLKNAKALLAMHAFVVKRDAEQEEAKKAEAEAAKAKEAARDKRRDEVTQELTGDPYARYCDRFLIVKKSIDRIIELEEAAKVS